MKKALPIASYIPISWFIASIVLVPIAYHRHVADLKMAFDVGYDTGSKAAAELEEKQDNFSEGKSRSIGFPSCFKFLNAPPPPRADRQ